MKAALFSLLFAALFGTGAQSQTINAASCNTNDVQSALNSIATDGTTVNIPAGTCTWTSGVTYTQTNSFTIQGAGNTTGSDGLGNPTGYNDQTIMVLNFNGAIFNITTIAGKSLRISGLSIKGGAGITYNGVLDIGGPSQSSTSSPLFRMDHNHFYNYQSGTAAAVLWGWMYGVVDHNLWDLGQGNVTNGTRIIHDGWGGYQNGAGSWHSPINWGSVEAMYFENNTYNYAAANDCNNGGRQVYRYNTFNYSFLQAHEGPVQGCRSIEMYNNNFTEGAQSTNPVQYYMRMGSVLSWNNSVTGAGNALEFHYDRSEGPGCGHPQSAPPNGLGYCGTTYGPSNWDQNGDSSGHLCMNQTGAGSGDLLQGYFPTLCDASSSDCTNGIYTGRWPNQIQEPVYEWLNNYTSVSNIVGIGTCSNAALFKQNRDYYLYTGSFAGASGVGSGLLSARPSTCTPLVAYWATDTNTLYQCATTNTWTAYYKPYTYPHPLDTSGSPAPPTNLQATPY